MKIAKEQGSIFNKAVSLVVLFTMVCAQIPALPMPDSAANKVRGFNSDVLSYHFNRADSELSVEKWMDKARNGLLSLEASWESYALDMYDSYEDFLEAKEALKKWGEQELEKRYAQYLVKSFTGNQISNLVIDLADVTENKNKEFVYHLDDDGNILIDPETGDPIIIRPGERNIEDDIRASAENYNTVSKENIDSLQTSLETVINNQYPDLLKYVNKDNVSDFEKVFLNESQKSIAYLATESKMIRDREQQIIRQKRTGDVWSLRKKSEKEAAEIISADLIRTTEELCNEGLAALEQKTENAKAGTGELALAGEEWLREYQEQFSRGLEAWKEAEERFFIRRIEWEQEAGVQFAEGQEAWMQAFNSLAVQKEAWETKVKVLFDSGEQLFRNASLELQTAIYNARIEFEKDAEFRITAGVERAEAWVNTYITSAGIVAGAKENIGFWSMDLTDLDIPNMNDSNFDSWTANKIKDLKAAVDKYNDEKNALISSNNGYLLSIESINGKIQYLQENPYYDITTSKHDSTDSDGNKITTTKTTVHSSTDEISSLLGTIQSWQKRINDNNNNIKNIESKSKIYEKELNAAKEMQTWKILYTKYLNLALDARNALVNDFSLVMGKGALADILNENVSSEDFNLDEYQVELIRAQAVSGYWEKRLEIAKAVDEYAKELTAGRVTNVESIAAQEQAKHAYDEALANYAAAQNNLNKKGEEIEAVKIQLDQSSKKLNEINNELFNLNKDYSILFSIKQMNDNEALLYEIAGKYKELLKQNNLSKETGSKAIYIKYLEREQELGLAETIESGTKLLKNLINGDGVATKSLNEISESISAIWIPQTVDEIVDDINAYKIPEDNIYYNVIVQLLEMIFHNSTEDSEDVVDEVIEDIASTDPNNIDISDSDAVDSTDIESDIETIDSNYREMLIEAVTAAKLVLQNNYNEVIYSLRLISASSITEWYLAQTGITEIELPDNTDIKTLLEIDALQSELALREKISEYEAEGVPDYIYIVKLKDFILKNQNNASLLNAYNRTEQTSQCIIDEKSDAAKNKLKQTFADFNITYEYINEPLHQKTVTSEEDENEEIEEDKEIEEEKEIENEETDSDLGIVKRNAAATDIFPGMKATARALENMNGNFEENFALLLTSLDSAAENLLPWAKNDYAEWKQSLLQYIAAYTIYNEIEYSANINILRDKIIYLNESIANEPDNAQMYQLQKAGLNYQYALLTETENQKKDIDASTEKHWREYINKDFLFKYNKLVMTDAEKADAERADNEGVETQDKKPENKNLLLYGTSGTPLDEIEIKAALSVAEGNLADKFEAAEFATRKLNDSLLLNTSKGNFFSDFKNTVNAYLENESKLWDDADLYVTDFMYKEEVNSEYAKLQNTLFMITTLQNDIQMFGNNYEIAEDNTLLEAEMENLQTQITDKQNEYNDLLLTYEKDAKLFTEEGDVYNALYNTAKEKYKTVEDKRFEYEKQDAIRRWAATSYLDYDGLSAENSLEYKNPVEELKYSEEKYNRSQVVLQSLLDLYDKNKTERPYQDEEYNKLYNEYKITFERMLTSIKVKDKLEAEIRAEIKRNDEYYKQYSKYLAQLDAYFGVSEDDITAPAVERSAYSLKDMITINEHGMLVFNRDGFTIAGNTSEEYKALNEYFQEIERDNTETRMSSDFEVALRDLNKYLLENVNNYAKYYQWALARDYLINSFKNNNIDLLNSAFSRDTELEDGNISKMPVGFFKDVSDRRNSDEAIKLLQHQSWAALSSEEKEYLEFYTILTLQGGGGENTDGFRNATAYHEYSQIKSSANAGMIADIILGASFAAAALVAIPFVWLVLASLVLSAASFGAAAKISATVDELGRAASNYQNTIIASFGSTLTATNGMSDYLDKYQKSCDRLAILKGEKRGDDVVAWEDIDASLKISGVFKDTEISQMQTYWQQMSSDTKSECKDVPAALGFLIEWSRVQRETVRANLENKYASDEAQRQENQDELRITMEKYIEGDSTETELQDAIKNTYGAKSPAVKNHIKNIESILIKSINGAIDDGTAYTAEYFSLINEMLPTIQNAYTARYIAEMNARTVEWEQKIYDLNQKQKSWYEAVELIISRGRDDWKKGVETIQARYNVWVKSYSEEYEKVNAQWGAAYMESLQDKAEWVAQATEAANKTSTNVTLAMLGADAEKRARAIDNRDFSSISTASGIMESQKALSEILNSAGINNMEAAFNAINNSSSTISTIVRTGLSGGNVWNSAEAKLAAVKIVNKSNEELAEREAKIVAANVRRTAESAIAGLQETVDSANKNFDRSMNDTFLLKGRWSRTGNTYKKDVIVDSSLTSTDRESVTVTSYIPYKMEAIVFKTDLSDKHLEGLESFAVNALVNQMNKEISDFAEGIFGKNNEKGEKEKGSFDKYLGDAPVVKAEPDIEKDKSGAFDSYGTGEIGRLMSDYIYWAMKEGSGIQKLSAPIYSQPLWSSDSSWFKSPSLEEVVEILMSVATAGLGASMAIADVVKHAAINVIDDFVFGTFDGLKTGDWANVGLEFGKTVTTTFSTDIAGWGARKVSSIAGGGRSPIVKALITAGITTAASMASAAVTGVVNALSISEEGKLQFSRDAYEEGIIRSVKGVAVSVVNTMTSGLLEQFNIGKIITKGEVSGPEKLIGFNKTNIADVGKLNNLVGSLAGQAMNYALNGDFALNLLNLNKLTGGEYKSGLLELHLTKNGASMNIGTGGADVSYGNIASAMKGANVWALNNDINSYSETSGNENKITLRAQYGYGDAQQRQNLYDILNGGAKLNMVENIITADGEFAKGQTELLDGQRVINLVGTKEKMSIAEQFAMAITLGHESYRDGVTDINNLIETQNAVFWHSAMAVRMIQDEVYTNAIGAVIAGDKNLQNDISAYLTGNINFFNQYVNANYDSSADYWKLKQYKDGSILLEDDEKKDQLTIEYYDSDKTTLLGSTSQVLSNKDGIDGRDGRAASLAQMLGLEHLSKMLGIDTSKMSLNEAGVALLTKNGFEWNDSKGIWSSASGEGNFDMSAFTINGNLYTVLNDQGTLNWYSAKEEIIRDPMSYAILTNGKRDLKYGGLDSIIVTQYDLDGKIVNTITSNGWTTVQSLIPTKEDGNITGYTFKDFLKATWSSVVKGCSGLPQSGLSGVFNVGPETIAVGEVAYKLLERQTSNETIKLQKGDFYFQAVSGKLVSGSSIDVNGHTELSNSALLKHDTGYFGNTGCFVTGNGVQGSGVVWKQYMNFIKNNAQMPSGYVLRGTVSNKNSPVKVSKPMK